MDELIGRLVADVGIGRANAQQAVGLILAFLATEGPPDQVQSLFERLPGARHVLEAAGGADAGVGGVMGVGMKLMAAGLSMGQVQSVIRTFIAYVREQGGEKELAEIGGAIPGLAQFT